MAAAQTSSQSLKSIVGAALFGLGLVILLGNLEGIAAPMSDHLGTSTDPALGTLPVLVLVASHAFETYVFDHQRFLSGVLQILVSFWPLTLVSVGAALLRDALGPSFAISEASRSSSARGNRE